MYEYHHSLFMREIEPTPMITVTANVCEIANLNNFGSHFDIKFPRSF